MHKVLNKRSNGLQRSSQVLSMLAPRWRKIWIICSASQRAYLAKFIINLSKAGVAPEDVKQVDFDAFAITELARHKDQGYCLERSRLNTAVSKWEEIASKNNLCSLETIATDKDALKKQKQNLPSQLLKEIGDFEELSKREFPKSFVTKRNRVIDGAMIAHSIGCKLESFSDIDEEILESFAAAPVFGPIDQVSTRRNRILGEWAHLTREVLQDPDLAELIVSTRDCFAKSGLEMPEGSIDRLAVFDHPDAMPKLLQTCDRALRDFEQSPNKKRLSTAQAAVAIPLLNNLAVKRRDLLSATFDGPIRHNAAVVRPALMATIYGQRENIDLLIEDPIIALLDRYFVAVSQIGFEKGCLFVTAQNQCKSAASLTTSITRLAAPAGFQLSAQLLRDLAVKRMIEAIEKRGAAIGDDALKDVVGYQQTTNFTLRYEVFRTRLVGEYLQELQSGSNDDF